MAYTEIDDVRYYLKSGNYEDAGQALGCFVNSTFADEISDMETGDVIEFIDGFERELV